MKKVVLGLSIVGLLGCGPAVTPQESTEASTESRASAQAIVAQKPKFASLSANIPPNVSVSVQDARGRTWVGRSVTLSQDPAGEPEIDESKLTAADDLNKLSDLEFALRMMPVRLVTDESGNAAEYTLAAVDAEMLEAVHVAREKERSGMNMISYGPGETVEFKGDSPPPRAGIRHEPLRNAFLSIAKASYDTKFEASGAFESEVRFPELPRPQKGFDLVYDQEQLLPRLPSATVFPNGPMRTRDVMGTDQRGYLDHVWHNYWPYLANVQFTNGGSGTLIGRRTAMSAAHVFYNNGSGTGSLGWRTFDWRVAHVHTGDPMMITGHVHSGSPSYSASCYSVVIPAAWKNPATSWGEDFAIVDFSCMEPGSYWGWVNPAYSVSAHDYSHAAVQMHAYDGREGLWPDLSNQGTGSNTFLRQTLIYRFMPASSLWIDSNYSFIVRHLMDTEKGASGGGILAYLWPSELTWTGNHASSGSAHGTGRVLTASSWGFIQTWSTEF